MHVKDSQSAAELPSLFRLVLLLVLVFLTDDVLWRMSIHKLILCMLGALNKFGWEAKLKYLNLVLPSPFKVKLETGGWWVPV